MAAKSLLTTIGNAFKDVFKWLGSSAGQTVIQTGEAIAEAIDPGLTGIINIANTWLNEIIKVETLAAAAGDQVGSGVQKAAMVTTAMTPEILLFAQQHGLPVPTAAKIEAANDALVAFLNALDGKG